MPQKALFFFPLTWEKKKALQSDLFACLQGVTVFDPGVMTCQISQSGSTPLVRCFISLGQFAKVPRQTLRIESGDMPLGVSLPSGLRGGRFTARMFGWLNHRKLLAGRTRDSTRHR